MVEQSLVENYISKLKSIANDSMKKKNYETAMAAISACSQILYNYNQYYMDEELENDMIQLSNIVNVPEVFNVDEATVLFYDSFGLDLRGWAASFVKALTGCGYKVIYITTSKAKEKIPHIIKELGNNIDAYLNMEKHRVHVEELNNIFVRYRPKVAFFYAKPNDVAGAVVFSAYENKVKRIQIDLTDHAFWLGVKAADLFFESRDIGARIAVHERNIPKENIKHLDCAPYINRDIYEEALPFDIESERYIFSGGSLYKTMGDPEFLYYKALREILSVDTEIKFLYAGKGDNSQIRLLQKDFPDRVFLINERPDFFKLIENSIFYLNTYPMFGGLMMRYAALAGKLPITLKHDDDADGLLFNQNKLGIEFEEYSEFIAEIVRVIKDEKYRKAKEAYLYDSVMNEENFKKNLKMLIEESKTEYNFDELLPVNTKQFRKEYIERFDIQHDLENVIARKKHIVLVRYFPDMFLKRVLHIFVRR